MKYFKKERKIAKRDKRAKWSLNLTFRDITFISDRLQPQSLLCVKETSYSPVCGDLGPDQILSRVRILERSECILDANQNSRLLNARYRQRTIGSTD